MREGCHLGVQFLSKQAITVVLRLSGETPVALVTIVITGLTSDPREKVFNYQCVEWKPNH